VRNNEHWKLNIWKEMIKVCKEYVLKEDFKYIEITTSENELIFIFDVEKGKIACNDKYKVNLY
jgi:hypothetical protein